MKRWNFKKIYKKEIQAGLDILKRIEYLTYTKSKFVNPNNFTPMTKNDYIQLIYKNIEEDKIR